VLEGFFDHVAVDEEIFAAGVEREGSSNEVPSFSTSRCSINE